MTDFGGQKPRQAGGGFTLAELMVAMAISMILLLVVLGVVRAGGDGYDAATQRIDANVEARAALATLADDLASSADGLGNFRWREEAGAWTGSELSFLTFKPRSAQESTASAGDMCFVHYYTAITRQLEGSSGPYSRKLYRRLVSSSEVMRVLKEGGDFRNPVRDPQRREDEAVAFNVVQFLVRGVMEDEDGSRVEWSDGAGRAPDFLEVTLRVTDNQTAGALSEEADWTGESTRAVRLLGSETDPEAGRQLRTFHVVVPVYGD